MISIQSHTIMSQPSISSIDDSLLQGHRWSDCHQTTHHLGRLDNPAKSMVGNSDMLSNSNLRGQHIPGKLCLMQRHGRLFQSEDKQCDTAAWRLRHADGSNGSDDDAEPTWILEDPGSHDEHSINHATKRRQNFPFYDEPWLTPAMGSSFLCDSGGLYIDAKPRFSSLGAFIDNVILDTDSTEPDRDIS